MKEKFYSPNFKDSKFHCPYCGVFSRQNWKIVLFNDDGRNYPTDNVDFCFCEHCGNKSIWFEGKMIQPNIGGVPLPNSDLPSEIIEDYNEARDILNKSPRGASALLRLSIQKLCKYLGQSGNNINKDIAELVKKGLPLKIQQSLDYERVVGNNSVHPGQIDLKDNFDIALNLFNLVNIIADVMITQPKEIDKLYNSLPENQIDAINKRDKKAGL